MKKKMYCFMSAALLCVGAAAQTVSVGDAEVLSSGETVSLYVHYAGVSGMTSTHFEIAFPDWVTVESVEGTSDWTGTTFSNEKGVVSGMCPSSKAFTGEGDIAKITITTAAQDIGTYPVSIGNIRINGVTLDIAPTFNIAVVEVHTVVLDEESSTAPDASNGEVNVLVKRTVNAGEWSTICLPFGMTEEQVKAAFGTGVKLADFTSWSSEEDDEGDVVGIQVGFTAVSSIEANHPYIIKVTEGLTSFSVSGVEIAPEDEPTVQVGKKKAERGYFTGTYVADTTVPENDLFLSDNKFWYSVGTTKMKAFRGYFEFADVLSSVENAGARVVLNIGGETTGIGQIGSRDSENSNSYDLLGRSVQHPTKKGLYIRNGKKEVVH